MRKLGKIIVAIVFIIISGGWLYYKSLQGNFKELTPEVRAAHGGDYIKLSDGIISYKWYGPENGDIVVFVNGLSTPAFVWDRSVNVLANEGFRVLSFDHYGRGYSDRPDLDYDIDLYDRELTDLLEALSVKKPINLVGYSLGGAVVMNFADRHPDLAKKIALIAPAGFQADPSGVYSLIFVPGVGNLLMEMIGKDVMTGEIRSAIKKGFVSQKMMDLFNDQFQYRGYLPALLTTTINYSMENTRAAYERVGKKNIPTMLIWGTEDQSVPYDCAKKALNAIPHGKLHTLQNIDHSIAYSKPGFINPLLIRFFK